MRDFRKMGEYCSRLRKGSGSLLCFFVVVYRAFSSRPPRDQLILSSASPFCRGLSFTASLVLCRVGNAESDSNATHEVRYELGQNIVVSNQFVRTWKLICTLLSGQSTEW